MLPSLGSVGLLSLFFQPGKSSLTLRHALTLSLPLGRRYCRATRHRAWNGPGTPDTLPDLRDNRRSTDSFRDLGLDLVDPLSNLYQQCQIPAEAWTKSGQLRTKDVSSCSLGLPIGPPVDINSFDVHGSLDKLDAVSSSSPPFCRHCCFSPLSV
ncbi:hypothetical protein GE09DRAFT_289894 [Coniochaeta sp. 2T2.1]|nr:hypothetical protein GE09DRAFT_289894 [Coniochaeta sp. 2T2.1]